MLADFLYFCAIALNIDTIHQVNKLVYFLAYLCGILFFACQNREAEEESLLKIEELIPQHPDSASVLIEQINPEELNKSSQAKYHLLKGHIKFRKKHSLYQDTLLSISIDHYLKQEDEDRIAYAYFFRNRAFFDTNKEAGDTERALLDCLEAKKYAQKRKNNKLLGHIYYDIGCIYDCKFHHNEALANYKAAQTSFSLDRDIENTVLTFGKIGSIYNILHKTDSALFYQKQALHYMLAANDSSTLHRNIISALYKNIAFSYGKAGNAELRKSNLLKAYQVLPNKEEMDANIILSQITWAFIELNKPDSAVYYGNKYNTLENETLKETVFRLHHKYKMYKVLQKPEQALKELENCMVVLNKVYDEELSSSILEVQQKYDKEVLQNQYNRILVQRLYLAIIIIAVILLTVLVSWYFINLIKKKKTELLEAKQAILTFDQLLKNQDRKNEKLTTLLIDKLDLTRKVAQMNVVSTSNTKDFIKQYNKVFGKDLLDEISWENIYPVINDLYNGFITKIENNFPDLSLKDVQMCCFVRAGFKTEEAAVLLNYTQSTVRVKKTRLSRKMGFSNNDTFISYIMAL